MEKKVIAVSLGSFKLWGCPYCGYRSGCTPVSFNNSIVFECGECEKLSVVLCNGASGSSIGLGEDKEFPKLEKHPREGTPAHGRADIRPESGGEFFQSRGIGVDYTPGCFVCSQEAKFHHNIAGFVCTKEAGERVVKMFIQGALLDFRENEPDRVQVKIGACNKHFGNLKKLNELVKEEEIITAEMISLSISEKEE